MQLLIATSVLTSMFAVSGIDKVAHFSKVVDGLVRRLGLTVGLTSRALARVMILGAIAVELVAPLIIFRAAWARSASRDRLAAAASVALLAFTVLATLLYHFPPFTSAKYYPFVSNLSACGGLYLMHLVFARSALV